MNDITFKVLPKGEGKTKWLLDIAKKYVDKGYRVSLFTDSYREYVKFCEKYFSLYNRVCPIDRHDSMHVTQNDVIIVDDLFKKEDRALEDLRELQTLVYKIFITLEGQSKDTSTCEEDLEVEQLSMFEEEMSLNA